MDRRGFLVSLGAASGATIAGCASGTEDTSAQGSTAVRKPRIASDRLREGGWEQVEDRTRQVLDTSISFVDIEGFGRTTRYENTQLRRKLRRGTMGTFDATVMQLFATRIELNPDIDDLPGFSGEILNRVKGKAEARFEAQMKKQGLRNVREGDVGTIRTRGDPNAWMKTYSAAFEYAGMEFQVTESKSVEIPPGSIDVWGVLAAWKGADSLLVAGGACPGESFDESYQKDLTDLITVTVDVDLELRPEARRSKLKELIANVR